MHPRTVPGITVLAAGLLLLGGCHEYQIKVVIDDDGAGSRTTTLETNKMLEPDDLRLLALDDPSWRHQVFVDHEGAETHRFRRRDEYADLASWRTDSRTMIRGTADGVVRLVSDVDVRETRGVGRRELIYREVLHWEQLTDTSARVAASDYARFLHREFPDLPDSLVHELRGAMATSISLGWSELTSAVPEIEDDAPAELEYTGDEDRRASTVGARFNPVLHARLLAAGVDPGRVDELARATADWDEEAAVTEAIPGLQRRYRSSFLYSVEMPAPVTGGNADEVEGRLARFRVEFGETLPEWVVLEVICER